MATDDSDPTLRTAKFPKTRPANLTNKNGESGQEISLIANYIKILAAPKCNSSIEMRRTSSIRLSSVHF